MAAQFRPCEVKLTIPSLLFQLAILNKVSATPRMRKGKISSLLPREKRMHIHFKNSIKKILACLSFLLGFFWLLGGMTNTLSADPKIWLTSGESEGNVESEESRKVEEMIGLVKDPQLTGYVEKIGRRLVQHSPRQDLSYHFHVVDMPEPNAFALPDGNVYVSRGLLALLNSEDELANVLGHEIGHIAARHSTQRTVAAAPFALVTGIAAMATGIVSSTLSDVVKGIGGMAGGLVLAPYSRSQEREADQIGLEMAARSGWDPRGMATMLQTLEREQTFESGAPRKTTFLDTHPSTHERVVNTSKQATQVTRASQNPIAPTHSEFLGYLDGLLVGINPTHGVFVQNQFLHPDLDFILTFPRDWQTQNTPQIVVATAPTEKVYAALRVIGKGDDPMVAVRALEKDRKGSLSQHIQHVEIGTLSAVRLEGKSGGLLHSTSIVVTWIGHGGLIYEILGTGPSDSFQRYRPVFMDIANSFRPLNARDRGSINETRIQVVRGRKGETLQQLVGRTGNTWPLEMAAIANGLPSNVDLNEGQLIKIAVSKLYVSSGL